MREDSDLHYLVQLLPDVLVRGKVLLDSHFLTLEVFTRIQIVAFISCVMRVVVGVDSTSMDLNGRNDVVRHHVATTSIGVLNHLHYSVTVKVSLVYVPLLLLLRDHLVVIVVVGHLILRQVSAPRVSGYSFNVVIVSMRGRRG